MSKNLENYETVKSRKQRFYKDWPEGRIVVSLENPHEVMEQAVMKATVYLTRDDQDAALPRGVGYALEVRDKELKTTRAGKQYESVNYTSWLENCEESAVGRALDNAGYASGTCSREEMEKAQRNSKALSNNQDPANWVIPFGKFKGRTLNDVPANELISYASYIEGMAQKEGKPLSGPALEYVNRVNALLNEGAASVSN